MIDIAKIWFFMIVIGIVGALVTGNALELSNVIMSEASNGITFAINIAGVMALWMGLMNIAKESGLIQKIGNKMSKILRVLFPNIPNGHPAMDYIIMNITMNMFGAGNGATAFGIKAMDELQNLNRNKNTATNDMIMFLVVNISSVQIVPFTMIKLRMDMGSSNPSEIIITTILATLVSTVVAIVSCKFFEKNKR
ncbi:MAG: spore maturation protein [Clostridioides sp.]|nr:spore maturation protein [Clostridioides sp.]